MNKILRFLQSIRSLGVKDHMSKHEIIRLGIFNLINFFGFITGLLLPIIAWLNEGYLPIIAWIVAASPAFISLGALLFNYFNRHPLALFWYFTLYPLFTSLVYLNSIDAGIELFFILYAVLGVFFLQKTSHILAATGFSLLCYVLVFLVQKNYRFVMAEINYAFYVLNHIISLLFIFLGLFLIKQENMAYQNELLISNNNLIQSNAAILEQKEELAALNQIKTKMFSIISHDIRLPLYGLKQLFSAIEEYNMPGEKIKTFIPEVVKDLNSTTDLIENLLQWSKSQMKGEVVNAECFDLNASVEKLLKLLRLQADHKKIELQFQPVNRALAFADRSMIETVIRNLCTNAIKFTPEGGTVCINIEPQDNMLLVQVKDSGIGMKEETLERIFANEYYSTKGTSNEPGTGLGLMICREFVRKNGGALTVSSTYGAGTTFSFVVPAVHG